MKKLLLATCLLITLSLSALGQNEPYTTPLSRLKGDYNQVAIVAHVKIKNIRFAADDIHPLYVVDSEIVEPFKGRMRRGQQLEFYFHAEEGFDVNQLIGKRWVIFLEGRHPVTPGGKVWYELENSKLPPSQINIARLRRIKSSFGASRKR